LYRYNAFFDETERRKQTEIFRNYDKSVVRKKYLLPLNYYPHEIFYFEDGLGYLSKTDLLKIKGKDVLDCGAFIGDSSLIFTKYHPSKVYCFEPVKNNYKLLLKTVSLNKLTNKMIPKLMGVGNKHEWLPVYGYSADSSVKVDVTLMNKEYVKQKEKIEVIKIDDFVFENNLDVGLIKYDIEGNEYNAIVGAQQTIKKFKPLLIVSIYHTAKDFFEIKPFLEKLNPKYKFLIRKLDPFNPTTETVLIAY